MAVLQEDTVRQLYFKQGITGLREADWEYITKEARAFAREHGVTLEPAACGEENTDIRPARQSGYVTPEGETLSEKPEHMTHLYGNVLVSKEHPRISLRGRLDSLEADIVALQTTLERGDSLAGYLEETLRLCRSILSCEVTGKPLGEMELFGLTAAGLRERSQHPKRYYGIGHILVNAGDGAVVAGLNCLRTRAREAELAAVTAFRTPDGVERPDLLRALNRLSSAFYILMLSRKSGLSPAAEERKEGS